MTETYTVTYSMPKVGDRVFVRAPYNAEANEVSHPNMLRPAIVTNVWGPTDSSLISAVAFNDQAGPASFACPSIPHFYQVNPDSDNRDYFINSLDEEGE